MRFVGLAVAAAALYALSVPLSKLLMGSVDPGALAGLARLRRKVTANPAARSPEPVFSAVIVGAGEYARYDRDAGSFVIPLTSLGV